MTSKADQLVARLGDAQRKVAQAERALIEATAARMAANTALVEADRELDAARDAIEREAAGL